MKQMSLFCCVTLSPVVTYIVVFMISTIKGRPRVNVNCGVYDKQRIMANVLAMYRPTWCDIVATYRGIGIFGALKTMGKDGICPNKVGDIDAQLSYVMAKATRFLLENVTMKLVKRCGLQRLNEMITCTPKRQLEPPTTEATHENVVRSHLQVAILRPICDAHLSILNPKSYW